MEELWIQLCTILLNEEFVFSIFRVTAPILLAAMGAVIAEKAGVSNIGLEGIMLISAFIGVVCAAYLGSTWLGLLGAVVTGAAVGLFMAYFSLKLHTNIILVGITVNLLGAGGTVFFMYVLTGDLSVTSSLQSGMLPSVSIPLLEKVPVLGGIISGHNILTYLAFASVFAVRFMLNKTRLGLRMRAVGENAGAAESVGICVNRIRTIALMLSGILAGAGGAFMSMAYLSFFSRNMTAGRGFIAIAATAMGAASPVPTLFSSLLFGFADALSNAVRTLNIPIQLVSMIPYVVTIIGLVMYSAKKREIDGKRSLLRFSQM